jgi:hypothetical protein
MNLEQVKALRALLASPEAWTQRSYARSRASEANRLGETTCPTAQDATCWCFLGGCYRVTPDPIPTTTSGAECFEHNVAKFFGFLDAYAAIDWNDALERTHAEVLARIDAKIAELEAA